MLAPDLGLHDWSRILVQVTIYRMFLIGRDGYLDQSEAYDIYGSCMPSRSAGTTVGLCGIEICFHQ